jgi:uncharacterized membrane protein
MTASAAQIRGVDRSRIAAVVLALVGLVDSAYLAYMKLTNQLASCSNLGDCETVNSSRYSEIGGVPIALLGAAAYLVILGAVALDQPGSRWAESGRYAFFGLSLVGTLYSLYLTYLEVFVLRAVCPFCVASAVVMILLFVLSIVRLRAPGD